MSVKKHPERGILEDKNMSTRICGKCPQKFIL
jgi:hypothetical protein